MTTVNVLVMLHGITLSSTALDHAREYEGFWEALQRVQPKLREALEPVQIEWGHEPPNAELKDLRDDQKIMRAEGFIDARTRYDEVRRDPSPFHHPLETKPAFGPGLLTGALSRLVLRPYVLTPFKQRVMVHGFSDALYYSSPDGERAVRRVVYGQVLERLEPYRNDTVRLHVASHSLGVTVAFDFLFGLFETFKETPGFIRDHRDDPAMAAAVERYTFWREKRKAGDLLLGSKASAGGQLPLLMMRTQRVVDLLAANQLLDAGVIGIRPGDPPKWKIFYDPDDALGFPTRRLFHEQAAIQEYEVETGWFPVRAHTEYWRNRRVQREIAQLIVQNLG